MHELQRILDAQHGLATSAQLASAAVARHQLRRWLADGLLVRQFRGVYAAMPLREPRHVMRARAGLLYAGPDVAIGYRTRLELERLPAADGPVHLVVPRNRMVASCPGLVAHHPRFVPEVPSASGEGCS